jgi:hypothetical protein
VGAESNTTDAKMVLVRTWMGRLVRYLVSDATTFTYNNIDYVTVNDGPLTCAMSSDDIQIDRYGADFRFYAPSLDEVYYREYRIPVVSQDGYLTRDPAVGAGDGPQTGNQLRAAAYPNPFNPSTTLRVELQQRADVRAAIYDVNGKLVRPVWNGELPSGTTILEWDGLDHDGVRVASGVYFLRVDSAGMSKTLKLVVLK